jgi:protein-tyrosine phosphatase
MAVIVVSCSNKKTAEHARFLPLEGAYNVRDLGGYTTQDGKTIKWRTVLRSGDLNHLTDSDLKYLAEIPLKTTIDFRDSAEIATAPDRESGTVINQLFLPIETGSVIDFHKITPELAPTLLVEGNKHFVIENQPQYREFFKVLLDEQAAPLLFHCSAGKDRAGFAAALFLSALGVERETIIEDYLLTNEGLKDKYAKDIEANPAMRPLMEARREYIQAAFDVIDQQYGGTENYLTKNLDVDLNKMKRLYSE